MITINIKERIREYFFIHPTKKMRVRQIERDIGVPLPSAIRYSKELEKDKILKSEIIAGIKLYSADRVSAVYRINKMLFNLKALYGSKLIDFLITKFGNPTIILFGSYSRGEDTENSDIDLYIEANGNVKVNLGQFENELSRKIQLFVQKGIKDVSNKELANNIINGIVINGFLEAFK